MRPGRRDAASGPGAGASGGAKERRALRVHVAARAAAPRAGFGEISRRTAVVLAGVPAAVAVAAEGGWVLGAGLAVLAGGGALEVYRLAERRGVRPFRTAGALGAAAFPLAAAARPDPASAAPSLWGVTLVLLLAGAAAAAWRRPRQALPLEAVAVTVAGALYTGGTLSAAVFLRHLPAEPAAGVALLMFPVAVVWSGDTAAFLVGRRYGRRKLSPAVSPGKTLEGAVAGVAAAVAVGAAYPLLVPALAAAAPAWAPAVSGLVLALVALAGDLAKSAWKREAGVKDSGRIFPGHGGIVDRLDSLFFALPVALALAILAG